MANLGLKLTNTFSDLLTEKKFYAVARPCGALTDLVQFMTPALGGALHNGATDQQFEDLFSSLMQSLITDEVPLTGALLQLEINSLVDDIAAKASAHIQHARSVVRPMVVSLAERYQDYLNNVQTHQPSTDFNIVSVKTPAIVADQLVIDELRYTEGRRLNPPDGIGVTLPNLPYETLVEMLEQASSGASGHVREWVMSKPEGWLESLWVSFFCTRSGAGHVYFGDVSFNTLPAAESAEAALALYLWAKRMAEDPTVTGARDSLSSLTNKLVAIADFGATIAMDSIKKVALANSTNTLLLSYNEMDKTIYVNGDLYNAWLEKGGCPETILGMVCAGELHSSAAVIDEKAVAYQKAWQQYCMIHETKERNNKHLYSRSVLLDIFNKSLAEFVEDEKDIRRAEAYFAATRYKMAERFVDSLTLSQLEDPYFVALHLVAKIRFDYTSAFEILSDIEQATDTAKGIDVREAALLAVINYLGDFLAQQISLKSV